MTDAHVIYREGEEAGFKRGARTAIDGVTDVLNAGLDVYRPDGLLLWLSLGNKTLPDGKSPLDCIADGQTNAVLQVIEQLATGAFS